MKSVRLLLEYDGSAYHGWQSQPSGGTVQDVLTQALHALTGAAPRLTAASRTDAGVHALGQVAVFATDAALPAPVIMRALNARLPLDIRVLSADEVDPEFHPRYNAEKKRYCYLVRRGIEGAAFIHRYAPHVRAALDMEAMKTAASYLVGRHDFASFRGAGCSAKTTVRTVTALDVQVLDSLEFMAVSLSGGFVRISIEADAFLRHMVRNIVGTLIEVGRGRLAAENIPLIIAARDRTVAGPTAPACGLFLEKVYYRGIHEGPQMHPPSSCRTS